MLSTPLLWEAVFKILSQNVGTVLLSDGCATMSPDFASQCIQFNTNEGWGFVLSCEGLAKCVDCMQREPAQEYRGIFTTHRDISAWI